MDNTDIKILSNLDLLNNDVSNAKLITGNSSSISFEASEENKNNLFLKAAENSYVNIGNDSIEQSCDSINLTADNSTINMTSDSIDIKSSTITMSHPTLESESNTDINKGIQFKWDSTNNTLIIGKKVF